MDHLSKSVANPLGIMSMNADYWVGIWLLSWRDNYFNTYMLNLVTYNGKYTQSLERLMKDCFHVFTYLAVLVSAFIFFFVVIFNHPLVSWFLCFFSKPLSVWCLPKAHHQLISIRADVFANKFTANPKRSQQFPAVSCITCL